jgi:hypothetical protein
MHQDLSSSSARSFDTEIEWSQGVRFDSDRITLEGRYFDELSAYRARRNWIDAFENNFLLDQRHDYNLSMDSNLSEGRFVLRCTFSSACGRYAFWRLINHQAPDVQYLIEVAHIPNSESAHSEFLAAPDLTSVGADALVITPRQRPCAEANGRGFMAWIRQAFSRFNRR